MYKMKPHAMKAAEKLGLDPKAPDVIYKGDDGLWHVRIIIPENPEPQPVATGATFPDRAEPVPKNPVAFIRHILATTVFASRKEALSFFQEKGINSSTAKTQYQRFKK